MQRARPSWVARFASFAQVLPLAMAVLAFGLVGAPLAHAYGDGAATPSLTTELLSLASESVGQLLCAERWTESWTHIELMQSVQWSGFGTETIQAGGPSRGIPLLGLGLLGLAAVVVLALGRMRLANEHKRLDVAQRLIEQGMDPPATLLANPARNDLRKGIVLLFAGGGILAAGLLTADRGMAAGALVPEFIGAGYLVSYWLAARAQRGDT